MNTYTALKEKQEKEINNLPIFFAFNDGQFAEGLKKAGLTPTETNKLYRLGNTGGLCYKADAKLIRNTIAKHRKELATAIAQDLTGDDFIFNMFNYELENHEYLVTGCIKDTLHALNLTLKKVKEDRRLRYGLNKARHAQLDYYLKKEVKETNA